MDIDFIKWLCDKAEGFGFDDSIITLPNGNMELLDYLSVNWNTINYPLLLQRAIESFNLHNKLDWFIHINPLIMCWEVDIQDDSGASIFLDDYNEEDIDKAKESALLYIYEQEKK